MTKEEYGTCYNSISVYLTLPYSELVETYALGLLGHKDAARTVQEWVYERGFERTADTDLATSFELWPLFRDLTRELCLKMLTLPEEDNPLARPDSGSSAVPTTKLEMFYQLFREMPFDCRRVLLLTHLFGERKEQITCILNEPLDAVQELIDRGRAELGAALLRVSVS